MPRCPERPERLEARITKKQKELVQRAASIEGRTLTDFIVHSGTDAASRIVQEQEAIILSERDRKVFLEAFLNPPEPNNAVKAAVERYKQFVGE